MTTCIPLKPFRCWQYVKGEPAPEWVDPWWHFACRDEGDWVVKSDYGRTWYTPAEFAERFRIEVKDRTTCGNQTYAELFGGKGK
jgi:hypothetical protein